jgi:formylmethanofuran dehydrogenase subunit E
MSRFIAPLRFITINQDRAFQWIPIITGVANTFLTVKIKFERLKMSLFQELLQKSASFHNHLCPRQVLGVRIGLTGGRCLGLDVPQTDKRILTLVETDGCFIDGLAVATGCNIGRRSMYVYDFGKVAATFIDTQSGRTVRIVPSHLTRKLAKSYAPEAESRWHAYLLGYQRMPDEELLTIQEVILDVSLAEILSKDGYRVNCDICGSAVRKSSTNAR